MTHSRDAPTEREKWDAEVVLKRTELDLKGRELDIRERESRRARWSNPLVLAIAGAALAAAGNVVATYYGGRDQRATENTKHLANLNMEREKAESQLILEIVKTGNTEKASENLKFLVATNLIAKEERRAAITKYVKERPPGTGISLPSTAATSFVPISRSDTCYIEHIDIDAVAKIFDKAMESQSQYDDSNPTPIWQYSDDRLTATKSFSIWLSIFRAGLLVVLSKKDRGTSVSWSVPGNEGLRTLALSLTNSLREKIKASLSDKNVTCEDTAQATAQGAAKGTKN